MGGPSGGRAGAMVRDEFGTRKEDSGNLSAQGELCDAEDVLGGVDTHQDLYLNSLDPAVSQQWQHCVLRPGRDCTYNPPLPLPVHSFCGPST